VEAVLVAGFGVGAMYALVGLGLVLEYRYSKVINLAHGGQALLAAYIFNDLRDDAFYPAIAIGVLTAGAVGLVIEYLAVERLRGQPPLVRMMVTLGILMVILGISIDIWGGEARFTPALFTGKTFEIFGVVVAGDQLIMIITTAVITVALTLLFRFTSLGIKTRAASDRPQLAETFGIDSVTLGRLTWFAGGLMAGLAGILLTPLVNLDPVVYTLLVVVAYTGLLVGRMESIPLTVIGGVGLGLLQSLADYEFDVFGIREIVAFGAALVALLIGSRALEWSQVQGAEY
jgi:branched-chain amino acid transport system permease protein